MSARRLAVLGGSQHFSYSSRSLAMSVNPTAAGFTSRALPSEARTEKADLLTSEGVSPSVLTRRR